MPLPDFTDTGDLPVGVHSATLTEVLNRFGAHTPQRQRVAGQLELIYQLVVATERMNRFIIFGSFITSKLAPADVDIFIIMADNFQVSEVMGDTWIVFNHLIAQAHFGASIFWVTRRGALGGVTAAIEDWQIKRDGTRRGIIEITSR